jgi:type IV secretory pathway TrbL component
MQEQKVMSTGETIGGCAQFTAAVLPIAEKELAAFARAVTELFGAEQARRAVEDWMEELELSDWPTGSARPDCRQVTIAAAARLANRVNIRHTVRTACTASHAGQRMSNDGHLGK